jgi:cytochrome c556
MMFIKRVLVVLLYMAVAVSVASAQEDQNDLESVQLSPPLMELLRAEMQAVLKGIQSLPAGIATANWHSVASTAEQISGSYLFEQKLTPAQRSELASHLPEYFRKLDAQFHLQARKLEAAARNHDSQLAAFYYYRLLDSCTTCHSAYASSKFPGFGHREEAHHH